MAHNSHVYRLHSFARLEPLHSDSSCFAPDCSTVYQGSVYLHDRLDQWVIGRGRPGAPCDIPILNEKNAASSIHAVIYYARRRVGNASVFLKNLSEHSSTWVNGKEVEKNGTVELHHLDKIWLGYIDGQASAGLRFINLHISRPFLRKNVLEVTLGAGAFGEVHKVHKRGMPQQKLAVKVLDFGRRDGIARWDATSEIAIVKELLDHDHQHIVPLFEVFEDEDRSQMYLYTMEFLPLGDLRHVLEAREQFATLDEILTIMRQLLDALSFLHEMGIVHRDVKFLNILVRSSAPWWTLLADFGTAKRISQKACRGYDATRSVVGTRYYIAPEVALGRLGYGALADAYSSGVVLFVMLQGDLDLSPYRLSDIATTLREHVQHRSVAWDRLNHRRLEASAKGRRILSLVRDLLETSPGDRLSVGEALLRLKGVPVIKPCDLKGNVTQPGVSPSLQRLRASLISAADDIDPCQVTCDSPTKAIALPDSHHPSSQRPLVPEVQAKRPPRPRHINPKWRVPEPRVAASPARQAQEPETVAPAPLPVNTGDSTEEVEVLVTPQPRLARPVRRSARLQGGK